MSDLTKEVHSTTVSTHKLIVDGVELVEEKKTTTITSQGSGKLLCEIISHERRIGNKSVIMIKEDGTKKEETELTDEEKNQFDSDWKKLWKPTLNHQDVEKMLQ